MARRGARGKAPLRDALLAAAPALGAILAWGVVLALLAA